MSGAVRIDGVVKRYGTVTALDAVSLSVAPGELVALLGPSGCGKTTLLRAVAGLVSLDEGSLSIAERDMAGVPTRRRPIGMVFQHYALFPNMTVARNVAFPLRVRRAPQAAQRARVEELLALVGLDGMEDRYPSELSGGQQQRVAIARALAPEPDVLLLDEPLSALDAVIRTGLRDEIRRIQQRVGTTALYVTHDQSEAMAIADRVAVMDAGRVVEVATPAQIYERPASATTALFVGSRNALELPVTDRRVRWGEAFDVPAGHDEARALAVFRPEDVQISDNGGVPATVEVSVFLGAITRLHLDVDGAKVAMDLPTREAAGIATGSRLSLRVPPSAVRVFAA